MEETKDTTSNDALLGSLEKVVMDLNDMENMIYEFDDTTAEPLFAKVNDYIRDLQELQRLGSSCKMQVPVEALDRLDDDFDQNPEIFSRELLARCKDEFGQLNTRIEGIKSVEKDVTEGWRCYRERGTKSGHTPKEQRGKGTPNGVKEESPGSHNTNRGDEGDRTGSHR